MTIDKVSNSSFVNNIILLCSLFSFCTQGLYKVFYYQTFITFCNEKASLQGYFCFVNFYKPPCLWFRKLQMVICYTCTENICFNCTNVLQAVLTCTGKEFHFEGWFYFYSFINIFSMVQPAYVCPYVSQRLVLTIRLRWCKGEAQGAYFWMDFRAALYYALMCISRRPLGNKFSFLQHVLLVQYMLSSQNISNLCHFTSSVTLCKGVYSHTASSSAMTFPGSFSWNRMQSCIRDIFVWLAWRIQMSAQWWYLFWWMLSKVASQQS